MSQTLPVSGSVQTSSLPASVVEPGPMLVVVQRDWNGWRKALAPVPALEDVHWRQPAGAPRPIVHAYVSCQSLLSGEVPHECAGAGSHRLLVCVLKQHTVPIVFDRLARQADEAARLRT